MSKKRKFAKEAELYQSEQDFLDAIDKESDLPTFEWLQENFKTKSAQIRYLGLEKQHATGKIAAHLNLPYRHVYSVLTKAKHSTPTHYCPICLNRKG